MALKSKNPIVYRGLLMDSVGEMFFAMWLNELMDHGLVKSWNKCIDEITVTPGLSIPYLKKTQLKTKVKEQQKEFKLLRESVYTPDFQAEFSDKLFHKLVFSLDAGLLSRMHSKYYYPKNPGEYLFYTSSDYSLLNRLIFEVKPSFDQNNMTRLFVNNQKFIWDSKRIFINLIEPEELFEKTFMPIEAMPYFKYTKPPKNSTKKPGDWKVSYIPKTLKEYLDGK